MDLVIRYWWTCFNFKAMPGHSMSYVQRIFRDAGTAIRKEDWAWNSATCRREGIIKGHVCLRVCTYVLIYSFIHLLFMHSSIHLLFIYPSVSSFIHSSYPYWNPCSVLGIIVLLEKRDKTHSCTQGATDESPNLCLWAFGLSLTSPLIAASVYFSVDISCHYQM